LKKKKHSRDFVRKLDAESTNYH